MTPDGLLCYSFEQLSGSKKVTDRVTVLCCANMTGSDKLKLVVIGKSRKPRCFQGINIDTLPVTYHSNSKAWMTSVLFEEWIRQWDAALARHGQQFYLWWTTALPIPT